MAAFYHARVEEVVPINSSYGERKPWHLAEITFSTEIEGRSRRFKEIMAGDRLQKFSRAVQDREIQSHLELYQCIGKYCVIYVEEGANIQIFSKEGFQD